MSTHPLPARLTANPEDYARLEIMKGQIAPWEDGLRTTGGKGTYEWWYLDAHLSDGSKLVIVFYAKAIIDVGSPLAPQITLTLDWPDGTHLEKLAHLPASAFASA